MKVLLLSPYPEMLHPALDWAGDAWQQADGVLPAEWPHADFIISFGYRYIISGSILKIHKDKIINIHLSFLPWNRGADPNFWSWFDDTKKGVTIHRIDEGIDTGNIIVQQEVTKWRRDETLSSSWHYLMAHAKKLFEDNWRNIRHDALPTRKADCIGSYHRSADKTEWFEQLPLGWDTPVRAIKRLGSEYRASQQEAKDQHPRARKYRQQTLPEL